MNVLASEICRGLVLFLDPDVLERNGASYSCAEDDRVKKPHFFICLGVDKNKSAGFWVPAFSKYAKGRQTLDQKSRTGHENWTTGTSYLDPTQVWTAKHEAVILAAQVGNDLSTADCRNKVLPSHLPGMPTPSTAAAKPGGGTGAMPTPASE